VAGVPFYTQISLKINCSERKRPLRRPRHRWEGNIRLDFREIEWDASGPG
jgi:hypothetical protein